MSENADPIGRIKIARPEDGSETNQEAEEITGFEDLASYNWLDETDPAILVPGRSCWIVISLGCLILANTGNYRHTSYLESSSYYTTAEPRFRDRIC